MKLILTRIPKHALTGYVKVNEPIGEVKIKAEALTNEESDAVELKVPIQPKGIKKVEPLKCR